MTSTHEIDRAIYKSDAGYDEVIAWYDERVAAMRVPVESRFVPTRLGQAHVLVAGAPDSPPVVVLHGMNLNGAVMAPEIEILAQTHRVYAPDIIGMPGKSPSHRPRRRADGYADWLLDLLDGLGLARPAMVGLSFGGWLILKLGAHAPDRVGPMLLVDSGGFTPFTMRGQAISGIAAMRYIAFGGEENLHRLARLFYGPTVTPDPDFTTILGLGFRHTKLDIDPAGLPVLSALHDVKAPAWVLYGEHDLFFAASQAVAQAPRVLPNVVRAEVLPAEGHVWSHDAMRRIYTEAAGFLAG